MQWNDQQAHGHVVSASQCMTSQPAYVTGMLSVMSLLMGRDSCGNHLETTAKPWLLDLLLYYLSCRSLATGCNRAIHCSRSSVPKLPCE